MFEYVSYKLKCLVRRILLVERVHDGQRAFGLLLELAPVRPIAVAVGLLLGGLLGREPGEQRAPREAARHVARARLRARRRRRARRVQDGRFHLRLPDAQPAAQTALLLLVQRRRCT